MNTTATHAQPRMIDTGAARIEVISRGAGALVILLPSLGRAAEDFDDLATRVAQAGYQVLTPQPRGLGASVGPMQNITLHDYALGVAA